MVSDVPHRPSNLPQSDFAGTINDLNDLLQHINDYLGNLDSLIVAKEAVIVGNKVALLITCSTRRFAAIIEQPEPNAPWRCVELQDQSAAALQDRLTAKAKQREPTALVKRPNAGDVVVTFTPRARNDQTTDAKENLIDAQQDQEATTSPYDAREAIKWRNPFDSRRG